MIITDHPSQKNPLVKDRVAQVIDRDLWVLVLDDVYSVGYPLFIATVFILEADFVIVVAAEFSREAEFSARRFEAMFGAVGAKPDAGPFGKRSAELPPD